MVLYWRQVLNGQWNAVPPYSFLVLQVHTLANAYVLCAFYHIQIDLLTKKTLQEESEALLIWLKCVDIVSMSSFYGLE